jgi:raffinose/stachyose/melibiose transport system permease protein
VSESDRVGVVRRKKRSDRVGPYSSQRQITHRTPRGVVLGSWWWVLPALVLVLAIHYLSVGVGGFFAFTNWTGLGAFKLTGIQNFIQIFQNPELRGALINTLFLAIGFVIGTNVIGLAFALAVNRGLKTRYVLRVLIFLPVVLSPLATAYIWQFIFDYNGPLNAVLDAIGLGADKKAWLADPSLAIWLVLLVMVWQNIGLAMVIYLAGLAGVSEELEEAAEIDGAGVWRRFISIVLPQMRPAIAIATTYLLIQGLRIFDQVIALTDGGPFNATQTLSTEVFKQTFTYGNYGYGTALSLILTVLITVFALAQNFIARGRES